MVDTSFQVDAFQNDAFQIEEAVVEPPVEPPILAGGGGGGAMASSGRWVQLDRSTVFVDFLDARASARTVAIAIEVVPERVPEPVPIRPPAPVVHIIPLVSARARVRSSPMGTIARNDTLELLTVLDLVAKLDAKRRRA